MVQQRAGVQLPHNLGQAGDSHERNADTVASRVVAGRSAVDLLPRATTSSPRSPQVQLRRVPEIRASSLETDKEAKLAGIRQLIYLAELELTQTQRDQLNMDLVSVTRASDNEETQLLAKLSLIRSIHGYAYGDPRLLQVGPRSETERKNLASRLDHANTIFDIIAKNKYNPWLAQVFGATNVATAKAKYARAKTWMNKLFNKHTPQFYTDRSGYNAEAGIEGTSFPHKRIALPSTAFDSNGTPSVDDTILLIHEAMHAGNPDIVDKRYSGSPGFTTAAEDTKLTNAAHFEVVPRRIYDKINKTDSELSYNDQTFIPAPDEYNETSAEEDGTEVSDENRKVIYKRALNNTNKLFQQAQSGADNFHASLLNRLYTADQAAQQANWEKYLNAIWYYSQAEKLTIHTRSERAFVTDGTAVREHDDTTLISSTDMAISEGVARRLWQCWSASKKLPADLEAAQQHWEQRDDRIQSLQLMFSEKPYETYYSDAVRQVIQQYPITGDDVERDIRVTEALTQIHDNWPACLVGFTNDDFE